MSAEDQLAAMSDEAFDAIAYEREEAFVRGRTQDDFRLLSEASLDAIELAALRRIEEQLEALRMSLQLIKATADGGEDYDSIALSKIEQYAANALEWNPAKERQRVGDELLELREAWTRLVTGLIAVAPHLKQPYPDDDRWTPWSRFVGNEMDEVDAIVRKLTVTNLANLPITEQRPRDAGTSGATT